MENPVKHKKTFFSYDEQGQILAQLAQRLFGVSIPGDSQNLTGHSLEKQDASALRKGLELDFIP